MTIKQALKIAQKKDEKHKEHILFILCEFLKKDKAWVFLNPNFTINEKEFFTLVDRFLDGEPFEYIFEKSEFFGLDFLAQKGVLIPRFDSEILAQKCLELVEKHSFSKILEIGFGSGILSIVLAKFKKIFIQACDINPIALELAKKNAKLHGVENCIDFKLCDFRALNEDFDFIFSNPPYIKNDYILDKWVQNEPKSALFGGENGWEILEEIIIFAKEKNTKILACEIGYDQKEILEEMLKFYDFQVQFYKDFNGFYRSFVAYNNQFKENI